MLSDWNVLVFTIPRTSTDLEAIEIDVLYQNYSGGGICVLGNLYDTYGWSDGLCFGKNRNTQMMFSRYGGYWDHAGQSNNVPTTIFDDLLGIQNQVWQTLRVEYDYVDETVEYFINGNSVYTAQNIPLDTLSNNKIYLSGGTPCCSSPANVAWSNLKVYEGQ